jgi:hypothetical protein
MTIPTTSTTPVTSTPTNVPATVPVLGSFFPQVPFSTIAYNPWINVDPRSYWMFDPRLSMIDPRLSMFWGAYPSLANLSLFYGTTPLNFPIVSAPWLHYQIPANLAGGLFPQNILAPIAYNPVALRPIYSTAPYIVA